MKKKLAVANCPECGRECEQYGAGITEIPFKCWHCDIRFDVPYHKLAGHDENEAAWLKAVNGVSKA